jgi:large subunit ribosomal protein L10
MVFASRWRQAEAAPEVVAEAVVAQDATPEVVAEAAPAAESTEN